MTPTVVVGIVIVGTALLMIPVSMSVRIVPEYEAA